MAEPRMLKLQSPAYGDPVFYKWPLIVTKRLDEPAEIAETIRLVCDDFPELKYAVENVILKDYNPNDFDSMNQLCQRYNKAIRNILSLWKGRAPPPRMFQPPNRELLRHIINLCYNHAIREPERLNIYEPFSPEVYGETSFDMIAQILDEVQANNEQTFLDLGSGVGQVVLQAAASNSFKECMGVEKADTPAGYAKAMEREFKKWMNWFGKIYTDFTLEKGDFMDDKWKDIINDCGVVFVNNFAFGPVVNHHLKSRFQTMKEGSKIISSREFVPMNFKFNKRNLSELGAMIRVTEIKPRSETATVSWTGNSVSYFLHVVDRTRLEKYFSILKKKKEGQELDEDEISLCSESNYSVDTSGTPLEVETLEENLDDLYLGTTTRHQWQLLTDTIKQSKQEGKKSKTDETTKSDGKVRKKKYEPKLGKYNMKQKLLQKYKNTKKKDEDSLESSDGDIKTIKSNLLKTKKIIKKDMILQKYKHQKRMKSSHKSNDDGTDSTFKTRLKKEQKTKEKLKIKNIREKNKLLLSKNLPAKKKLSKLEEKISKKVSKNRLNKESAQNGDLSSESSDKTDSENESLDSHIDKFLGRMKVRMKDFIKRINMTEYAERLQVMIECETAKKKLLLQEINETEKCVQSLINDSLHNFSSRLVELDLAVKTPLDLLSKSSLLAEKHQELENKVVNMEIEVLNLEEKYQILGKGEHKKELETKLCGAILSALNHRRSLMDQQSTLSEQISILEKISHVDGNKPSKEVIENEEEPTKSVNKKNNRPKARPVAFVPPRMLSDNKKNTVSPDARHGNLSMLDNDLPPNLPRRRKRARTNGYGTRSLSCCSDASRGSESDNENQMNQMNVDSESSVLFDELISRPFNRNINANIGFVNLERESKAPISFPRADPDDNKCNNNGNHLGGIEEFLKTSGKLLDVAPITKSSGYGEKSSESLSKVGNKITERKISDKFLTNVAQQLINHRDLLTKQESIRVIEQNNLTISTSTCDVASPSLNKRKRFNSDITSAEAKSLENSIDKIVNENETLLRTKNIKLHQIISDSQISASSRNTSFKRTSCILPVDQFKPTDLDADISTYVNSSCISSTRTVFSHSDIIMNNIISERKSIPDLSTNHIAGREQLRNNNGKHNIYLPANNMPSTMTASVRNSKFNTEDILRCQYSSPDVDEHFQATFNKLSKGYGRDLVGSLLLKEQSKHQTTPFITGMKSDLNKISNAIIKDSQQVTRLKEKSPRSTHIQKVNVNDKAAMLTFSTDRAVPYSGHSIRNSELTPSISDIPKRDLSSNLPLHTSQEFPPTMPSNNTALLYNPNTFKIVENNNKDALSVSISFPTFKPDTNHHIDVISRSWNPSRRPEAQTDRFVNTFTDLVSIAPDTMAIPTLSWADDPKIKNASSETKPPPKKRGRPKLNKQNTIDKKAPIMVQQNKSNSLIHFQKEPVTSTTKFLLTPDNMLKNGLAPPIIINAKPPLTNNFAFIKNIKPQLATTRPQVSNILPALTPANSRQVILSNELANNRSISYITSCPEITDGIQPALSPRSPTFNHPRFVLLNMPPSVVVSAALNEKDEDALQRQHSMTSPTFPPLSNS